MQAADYHFTLRVQEPAPFGDVTLPPAELTGHTQAETARAMAASLDATSPRSPSEALQWLRRTFPNAPLKLRVDALMSRVRHVFPS